MNDFIFVARPLASVRPLSARNGYTHLLRNSDERKPGNEKQNVGRKGRKGLERKKMERKRIEKRREKETGKRGEK